MRTVVWIFGWGLSVPKQLRPYVRLFEKLGAEVHTDIARVDLDLVIPGNRARHIRALHERVLAVAALGPCNLHIHSMSDNGFLSLAPLLQMLAASAQGRAALAQLCSVTFDSAPGIYSTRNRAEFEHALLRGFAPQVARSAPAAVRPIAVVGFRGLVALFTRFGNSARLAMMSSAAIVAAHLPKVPITFLYGDEDFIIEASAVEGFAELLTQNGYVVTQVRFEGSGHLRHLLREPERYRVACAQQLANSRV